MFVKYLANKKFDSHFLNCLSEIKNHWVLGKEDQELLVFPLGPNCISVRLYFMFIRHNTKVGLKRLDLT